MPNHWNVGPFPTFSLAAGGLMDKSFQKHKMILSSAPQKFRSGFANLWYAYEWFAKVFQVVRE